MTEKFSNTTDGNDQTSDPQRISNRYLLHHKIGEGGMGAVYLATDRLIHQQVALKKVSIPVGALDWQETIAQIEEVQTLEVLLAKEFQFLAGLRHPHIISVKDYGFDAEKKPFFTMAYLEDAETLIEAAQGLEFNGRIRLIQQMLEALIYLHRRNILHRDLKPNNVLVTNGHLQLVDFGLSSFRGTPDSSGGSLLYLPPEILAGGDFQSIDAPFDLYAVGIMMYELFAGTHPFDTTSSEFANQVISQQPDLGALGVEKALAEIVGCLLSKNPKDRFPSVQLCLAAINKATSQPIIPENKSIRESFLQAAQFVGREAEIEHFKTALAQAIEGKGSAWLLGGESGVGKSRLLNEIQTQALVQGFLLLRGQAIQDGAQGNYGLWQEPLRHLLISLPDVDDLTASILLSIIPDIGSLLNRAVSPAPALDDNQAKIRLYTTITSLFSRSRQPLLLILEDLHWATDSLSILSYLTRVIDEQKLVIIGSYRDDEIPTLPEKVEGMTPLHLSRLTAAEVATLSESILGDVGRQEAVVSLIQRETEGNTFFVVEVVRALAEQSGRLTDINQNALPESLLPKGIREIVERRLARLPEWTWPLLLKAAVIGRELELPLIQLFDQDIDVKNRWLPLCADAAIVEIDNGEWKFSHSKIRDGLLDRLSETEKQDLHQEVAEGIEQFYDEAIESQAGRLTYHWQRAKNPTKERHYAYIAGKQAQANYAVTEAMSYFKRVLHLAAEDDLAFQFEVHKNILEIYQIISLDQERVLETINSMEQIIDVLADDGKRVFVKRTLADFYEEWGLLDLAVTVSKEADDLAKVIAVDDEEQALILLMWAKALIRQRKLDEAGDKLEESQAIMKRAKSENLSFRLANILTYFHIVKGDTAKSLQYNREAIRLALEQDDLQNQASGLNNAGAVLTLKGEYSAAENYLRESLKIAQQIGSYTEATSHNLLGYNLLAQGEYDLAIEAFTLASPMLRMVGVKGFYSYCLNNIGIAYFKKGAYKQATTYFEQSIEKKQADNDQWGEAYTRNWLGHLHLANQLVDEAFIAFQKAESLHADIPLTPALVESWIGLAYCFILQGETAEAEMYGGKAWAYIEEKGFVGDWQWALSGMYLYEAFNLLEDDRATALLTKVYNELISRAEKFTDKAGRQKYLTAVPENHKLVTLYNTMSFKFM